jgi:DNA-binding HxlR family transcriptional regulator
MDEHIVQHYLDQVPVEIREAVMELDTPQKWAIYIALTVDGDKYFNQLKKQFNANPKTLTDVLKSLVASGLVDRKVKQLVDVGDTNKNYYATTKLGEKLLMNLYEVVLPPLVVGEPQSTHIKIVESTASEPEEIYIPRQDFAFELPQNHEPLRIQLEGVRT